MNNGNKDHKGLCGKTASIKNGTHGWALTTEDECTMGTLWIPNPPAAVVLWQSQEQQLDLNTKSLH